MNEIFLILVSVFGGEPDKVLHEKCIYPTVMVADDIQQAFGSGVVVKSKKVKEGFENYVLTSAHFVFPIPVIEPIIDLGPESRKNVPPPPEDEKPIEIEEFYNFVIRVGVYEDWSTLITYNEYPSHIRVINREKDLCLMSFITKEKMWVADVEQNPKLYIGNDILRVGCGANDPFRLDYGKITCPRMPRFAGAHLADCIRISAPTVMGDSGGPVFHEGKVVGIVQALRKYQIDDGPAIPVYHMCYAVPVRSYYENPEIAKILKD